MPLTFLFFSDCPCWGFFRGGWRWGKHFSGTVLYICMTSVWKCMKMYESLALLDRKKFLCLHIPGLLGLLLTKILLGFHHSLCQNISALIYYIPSPAFAWNSQEVHSHPACKICSDCVLQSSVLDNSFGFCNVFLKEYLFVPSSKWTGQWLTWIFFNRNRALICIQ